MTYDVGSLALVDVPSALPLVAGAYEAERAVNPILPPQMLGANAQITGYIQQCISHGAVAVASEGRMIGFMGISALFPFKGQRAALIREVCHGSRREDRGPLYQRLYAMLGAHLRRNQARIHILAHFASDSLLKETLFQLGFGAFLAERVRDLSPVPDARTDGLVQERDFGAIMDLETEHTAYYRQAPIYLNKDDSREAVQATLQSRQGHGNVLFTYRQDGRPLAYSIVGECMGDPEGFILRNTNTAQIVSFYASPCVRGKGIGKALLNRSVEWARGQGFARLFVEHETANIQGSNFWSRHFRPYLYFSMRYVEAGAEEK